MPTNMAPKAMAGIGIAQAAGAVEIRPRARVDLGAAAAAATAAALEQSRHDGSSGASAPPAEPSKILCAVLCAVVERSGKWLAFLRRPGKTTPVGIYGSKADATAAATAARAALVVTVDASAAAVAVAAPQSKPPSRAFSNVHWNKRSKKWKAEISHAGMQTCVP